MIGKRRVFVLELRRDGDTWRGRIRDNSANEVLGQEPGAGRVPPRDARSDPSAPRSPAHELATRRGDPLFRRAWLAASGPTIDCFPDSAYLMVIPSRRARW